jgi:hypothetical protein
MDAEIGRTDDRAHGRLTGLRRALLLCLTLLCIGAAPATQPVARLRVLIDQLANRDSVKRENAFYELLALPPGDLALLRQAVVDSRPLLPGQTTLLRLAVRHIYISGAKYPIDPNGRPFLGLSWPEATIIPGDQRGVPVVHRVPGFAAYHALREGDLLQGIEELPERNLASTQDVGEAIINEFHAGQTITLKIVRDGKPMRVKVLLRPRPALVSEQSLEIWIEDQTAAADQYWDNYFGQMLGENVI